MSVPSVLAFHARLGERLSSVGFQGVVPVLALPLACPVVPVTAAWWLAPGPSGLGSSVVSVGRLVAMDIMYLTCQAVSSGWQKKMLGKVKSLWFQEVMAFSC